MGYRVWTSLEMFELLKYPAISVEDLALELGRSECSVRSKIQELNISEDYNKNSFKEDSLKKFCSDCVNDATACNFNPEDCLASEDAKLYKKFYNIRIDNNNQDKKIVIKKREKIKQRTLI